jgi:ADP-ribose pyrophosphatase
VFRKQGSRVVLSHPRLTVVEDDILLPDGSASTYLRYATTGFAVTVLCRRPDGAFLLQREYSYPPNERLLQLPGGGREDEEPAQAANR